MKPASCDTPWLHNIDDAVDLSNIKSHRFLPRTVDVRAAASHHQLDATAYCYTRNNCSGVVCLCFCVMDTLVNSAKTAEPIVNRFVCGLACWPNEQCSLLDGSQDLPGEEISSGRGFNPLKSIGILCCAKGKLIRQYCPTMWSVLYYFGQSCIYFRLYFTVVV